MINGPLQLPLCDQVCNIRLRIRAAIHRETTAPLPRSQARGREISYRLADGVNNRLFQFRGIFFNQRALMIIQRVHIVERIAQDRSAMGVRRAQDELIGLEAKFLFESAGNISINPVRYPQRITGENDSSMTLRILESENFD